jgi:hypothetical protein
MKQLWGIGLGIAAGLALSTLRGLPAAEAQGMPAGAGGDVPAVTMMPGGSSPNEHDLLWVLVKEKAQSRQGQPYERLALSLYKTMNNGSGFDLVDTREITYDAKPSQLTLPGHNPKLSPKEMKAAWEKELRERESSPQGR